METPTEVVLYGCDNCGRVTMVKNTDPIPSSQCRVCLIGTRRLITLTAQHEGAVRVKLEITL